MNTLVIVPTYNEIENIEPLTQAIFSVTPSNVHVLVVDDGSPDGTGKKVDELAKTQPRLHVLHRTKKMGLGTAYVNGFRWGLEQVEGSSNGTALRYDAFVQMDADFSHHPKYLPVMLENLEKYSVVIGSRYVPGGGTLNWGLGRKILSRGGSIYSRFLLRAPLRDFTGGFNGWKRQVIESEDLSSLRSDGYSFQIELKYRAFLKHFDIKEFPILFEDRKVGKSKMSRKIVIEALARVWSFRWRAMRQRSEDHLLSKT
jgi:dolichol-phosphate mannosyltransferase